MKLSKFNLFSIILQYDTNFFNYQTKFKEIEFNARSFSRDFPKVVKPLSVKFVLL